MQVLLVVRFVNAKNVLIMKVHAHIRALTVSNSTINNENCQKDLLLLFIDPIFS